MPKSKNTQLPAVALVYDQATTTYGGAEVVMRVLLETFPDTKLYTTVVTPDASNWIGNHPVQSTFLQKLPLSLRRRHQAQILAGPLAIESLAIAEPLVISVSASLAKGVITRPDQLHIQYLLTPTRFLYRPQAEILNAHWVTQIPGLRQLATIGLKYLRWWDLAAAARPDEIIAISKLVSERCQSTYHRTPSSVLYPPFIPEFGRSTLPLRTPQPFYFVLGRHVWYKRFDLAIQAAKAYKFKLLVGGSGPETKKLIALAGEERYHSDTADLTESITSWLASNKLIFFTGKVSNSDNQQLLQLAQAYLMPGVEDFGLTALEALAVGCPVLVQEKSGVAEIIEDSIDGILLTSESVDAIGEALKRLQGMTFSYTLLKQHAMRYSDRQFSKAFKQSIVDSWQRFTD